MSFPIALTWSYVLVRKKSFDENLLYERKLTVKEFLSRLQYGIRNFVLIAVITMIALVLIGDEFFSFAPINFSTFSIGFIIILVVDDVYFYCIHRIMHSVPYIYKKIHSVHHRAIPPIPIDYLYAHPIEAVAASLGLVVGLLFVIPIQGEISIYVFAAFTTYRTLHELALHSGMEVVPNKWVGFLGSSKHHYLHHKYLKGNYASGLTYLDKLFNTEIKK